MSAREFLQLSLKVISALNNKLGITRDELDERR